MRTHVIQGVHMKHIALAIALLVGCAPGGDSPPDSQAMAPVDAAADTVDAAQPQNGCGNMGNLPNSRNKTYVDGDPVDPGILNDIQDSIVGGKRGEWPGRVTVTPYYQVAWTLPIGGSSPYCQSSNATNQAWFALGIDGGDQLRGLRFDAFGNSGGTLQVQVFYGTIASGVGSGAFIGTQTIPNTVWTSYRADAVNTFGGSNFFVQPTLDDTNIVVVEFIASTVGVRIGNIRPILGRP